MAELVADGIWLLGRFSPFRVGAWVLEHRGKAALLEMPPFQAGAPKPWEAARRFVDERRLDVRWLLLTHAHVDHCFGFPYYREAFPRARLLAHRSFLEWYRRAVFDDVFPEDEQLLDLGGEPLFLLHAPKHSPQDVLVFFRGAVCTGDWSLGAAPDGNGLVQSSRKLSSLARVRRFLDERRYRVHTAFSAHANESSGGTSTFRH